VLSTVVALLVSLSVSIALMSWAAPDTAREISSDLNWSYSEGIRGPKTGRRANELLR
jgi:hypothetical protein